MTSILELVQAASKANSELGQHLDEELVPPIMEDIVKAAFRGQRWAIILILSRKAATERWLKDQGFSVEPDGAMLKIKW